MENRENPRIALSFALHSAESSFSTYVYSAPVGRVRRRRGTGRSRRQCSHLPRRPGSSMGLDLAVGLSKMLRPSEAGEMAMFGFLILLALYAARVIYLAPKSVPPQYKKYEDEKRRRQAYAVHEQSVRQGSSVRQRAPGEPPGVLRHTPRPATASPGVPSAPCNK